MQNDVSFEMPAHEMCLERRAVLFRLDGQSEYVAFTDGLDLGFMPDVVHVNGRKFRYQGVSDGRGFYREEPKDYFPDDTPHEPEIYDTHGSLGSMSAALRYAEDLNCKRRSSELLEPVRQMAQGFISAAFAVRGVDEAYKSRETLERVETNNLSPRPRSVTESIEFETNYSYPEDNPETLTLQAPVCVCVRPGRITDENLPHQRSIAPYGMEGLLADRDCLVCFGAGQVPENSQDSGSDLHTTASPCDNMPCFRCSEVLDLVSEMIENPPGLSGIKSPFGHIGNQYVDAGWVEALTRVKAHLVTGGSGTRETL